MVTLHELEASALVSLTVTLSPFVSAHGLALAVEAQEPAGVGHRLVFGVETVGAVKLSELAPEGCALGLQLVALVSNLHIYFVVIKR